MGFRDIKKHYFLAFLNVLHCVLSTPNVMPFISTKLAPPAHWKTAWTLGFRPTKLSGILLL
jgi:hypothetical protein